jgi:hypothetical protein
MKSILRIVTSLHSTYQCNYCLAETLRGAGDCGSCRSFDALIVPHGGPRVVFGLDPE